MEVKATIHEIIHLPENFTKLGNISSVNLLKQSGYFGNYDNVQIKEIVAVLSESPELVDVWIYWCQDKRTPTGWCFNKDAGNYTVYYYPSQGDSKKKTYLNPIEDCAEFIKLEIEDIRIQHYSNKIVKKQSR
jgi:hypothetical protein